MFTSSSRAYTRVLHLGRRHVALAAVVLAALLLLLARSISPAPLLAVVSAGEPLQRERFLRENLGAMAVRLGEMQARLIKLEAIGERVSNLAGVKPEEAREVVAPARAAGDGGRGGPYVPLDRPSQQQLAAALDALDERVDRHLDLFTLIESRLFEERLVDRMIPNTRPLAGPIGSGFGMRSDPFTGRPALHTGLDFPAPTGTPILAAAGGVVQATGRHPAYGQMLEIDHGNGLVTRYAHCSKLLVKTGDLVRRGQKVSLVGSTGRSTGPHLHFEVLLDGVQQNPAKFLAGGDESAVRRVAGTELGKGRR